MSKNVLLGKTSSLLDLTDSHDDSKDFFSLQFTTPKVTLKSTSKEGINKLPVYNKFSTLTDDYGDSVEAHISSSKQHKPTHSDDKQILINPTSKRKYNTADLDKTVGPTSSTGAVSKSKKPQQDRKSSKNRKFGTDPIDA